MANINFQSCEGCTELLFDPLADGLAQTGIYVSGIFQEPMVDAILAMLDRDAADAGEEDEEEEEEEDVDCN